LNNIIQFCLTNFLCGKIKINIWLNKF